jgi:hypothetical protein
MPKDLKKGDFNKDWGFFIERPFHIISKMASGRYLDLLGR